MRWRGDGQELFYLAGDGTMMAVPIKSGAVLEPGVPRSLFQTGFAAFTRTIQFDVTPDGQRFLILFPMAKKASSLITVVLNWPAALKKSSKLRSWLGF